MIVAKLKKLGFLKVAGISFSQVQWIEIDSKIKESISVLPEHQRIDFEYREVDEKNISDKKKSTINGIPVKMLPKKPEDALPNEIESRQITIEIQSPQPEQISIEQKIESGVVEKPADLQMPKKNKR